MIFEPTMFGRYCLIDQISKGGMSDIFLAKIASVSGFQKPVVIKKLLPQYSTRPRYVQRFINEAKTLSRLNHTNIVQIIDMGVIDSEYFIAMEYIEGRNVAHIISKATKNNRPPSLEFILHLILELAKGLAYAHRKKGVNGENLLLVHQDVNSFNVMASYEAEVKIIDFGIARVFLDETSKDGLPVAGKLLYFSPEQLQKKPLDRRVDIYGTGVLLYELLTGERLIKHQKTVKETVKLILEMDVSKRVKDDKRIPAELKPILIRSMALKPEDRYPWMEDFIADVRSVIKKLSLEMDVADFSRYMKEQFQKEILLDRRRMRKLLSVECPRGRIFSTQSAAFKEVSQNKKMDLLDLFLRSTVEVSGGNKVESTHLSYKVLFFSAGKTIFNEGDSGSDVYIVQNGKVRIFLKVGKNFQTLAFAEKGDFFGETALLGEDIRSMSAVAEEDCNLICVSRDTFAQIMGEGVPRNLAISFLEKFRDANALLEGVLMEDNLARFLFGLLYFQRRSVEPGDKKINLANLTSQFRLEDGDQLNKYISKLESLNVVETSQDAIQVKNPEKLANILNILCGRGKFMLKL